MKNNQREEFIDETLDDEETEEETEEDDDDFDEFTDDSEEGKNSNSFHFQTIGIKLICGYHVKAIVLPKPSGV